MRKIVPPGGSSGLSPLGRGQGFPPPQSPSPLSGGAPAPVAGGAPAHGVMSAQAYGAYGEAKEILAVAEKEAERIRQEAEQQRSESVRQGYEEGYRRGYEEALKQLARLEKEYGEVVERLEPQLVQLAIGVAEKIIGEEISLRPDAISDIVVQALKTVRHQREIVIRVHPSKSQALEAQKQKLFGVLSRAQDVRIVGDETLREMGCVIETEVGVLDADVEHQLAELRRALTGI